MNIRRVEKIIQALRGFVHRLLKIHPAWFGVAYVLTIPLFALLYALVPYQFYHSTMRYERGTLNAEATRLLDQLGVRIRSALQDREVVTGTWVINPEFLRPTDLQPDPEDGSVTFLLPIELFSKEQQAGMFTQLSVRLNLRDRLYLIDQDGVQHMILTPSVDNMVSPLFLPNARYSFPSRNDVKDAIFGTGLDLPVGLYNDLVSFNRAISGFPDKLPGSYLRMLYLSSVTITTLGYGDIVPVGPGARFLIALEAFIGIVIGGLFVSSIANWVASMRPNG